MKVLALICARGGSKGIPGKNLRRLAGETLLARAVRQAASAAGPGNVVVSTDAGDIAEAARQAGARVPFMRPPELARDDSPEWLVWRHALRQLADAGEELPDALLIVPTTAPLRSEADLRACLDEFRQGRADVVITVTEAHRNPYFNMVKVDGEGTVTPVVASEGRPVRRQDAPQVFDMTTVAYVARPHFVMTRDGIFEGRVRQVRVPPERAIDIDTPLDLRIAEFLAASA